MIKCSIVSKSDQNSIAVKAAIEASGKFQIVKDFPDYVFSIGGDGTFLRSVQSYIDQINQIKFIGINTGTLGFYTDFNPADLDEILHHFETFDQMEEFPLLELHIEDQIYYCVNEFTISNMPNVIDYKVYIDDVFFEKFKGTGLLFSTSSGSTAYNKSLNGSVVDPNLHTIQMTEIASINSNVYRTLGSSIVFSKDRRIKITTSENKDLLLTNDSSKIFLKDVEEIEIKISDKSLRVVVRKDRDFFQRIRKSFL